MIKTRKQMYFLIVSFLLILLLGTTTYAFFNYTRTGVSNTIRVGRIYFNTTQNNTINLTNIFPADSNNLNNTNSATVTVNITGDTEYSEGIEYKVSIVDVQNTVNGKEIPISFSVLANNLGTESNDYYNDRGSTTNVYNLVETGLVENDKMILVGYIKPDNAGINGSINITAYLDKEKVGISDTVSRIENGNLVYGETDGEWIAGRTILTTTEWNSLQTNGISFKVKVEANQGLWIEEPRFIVMKNLTTESDSNWSNVKANITSIEFSSMGEAPENVITSFDATDITSDGEVTAYILDDGLGNDTYMVVFVADDVIYSPENSMGLFAALPLLSDFNSDNFKVDNVVNMQAFFNRNPNLIDIDFAADWDVSNVEIMIGTFYNCPGLQNLDGLARWKTDSLIDMNRMFYNCTSLSNIDGLLNWNLSNATNISSIFYHCTNITNINALINWDVSNVIYATGICYGCTSLTNIDGLANWNTSNVEDFAGFFYDCTSLTSVDSLSNWNTSGAKYFIALFYNCTSLTNINGLKKWNTSNVEDMSYLFTDCTSLLNFDALANWNTSNVENMNFTFGMGTAKTKINNTPVDFSSLSNWNVAQVTNMASMFQNLNIISYKPFKKWNVGSVESFNNTFNQTQLGSVVTTLEGLESWNVSRATNMGLMFAENASLTDASAINNWDINTNCDFTKMFSLSPVHPEFTKIQGTWNENGTFTPSV